MPDIRYAHPTEKPVLKEIWQQCFRDPARFIDFYFEQRFDPDQTLVLVEREKIVTMLTVIPVCLKQEGRRVAEGGMLYAIATHPDYQRRGLAAQLMEFAHEQLRQMGKRCSIVVPATKELFDYYRRQGFHEVFYIREARLSLAEITGLAAAQPRNCHISPISPQEYNRRRENLLKASLGEAIYVSYHEEEIAYQQKLARLTGADLYGLTLGDVRGCAAVERFSPDRAIVKELILPDEALVPGVKALAAEIKAQDYVIRTPAGLGEALGGSVRPFGMARVEEEAKELFLANGTTGARKAVQDGSSGWAVPHNWRGYLGLAFD